MSNTALRAEKAKEIIFISDVHEKFYYEKLKEVRYQDVYHMRRNRWTSADGTQWKNCSVVPMHKSNKLDYIFGRRYRYGIRNTQRITTSCTPCSEDKMDVKSQAYGNKERY